MAKIDRNLILNKFGCKCAYCGQDIDLKSMQVDHVIPKLFFESVVSMKSRSEENPLRCPEFLTHLGSKDLNHIDNLFPACRSCNGYKNCNGLEIFRSEIEKQAKRLVDNNPMIRLAQRFGIIEVKPKKVQFYFETINPKTT